MWEHESEKKFDGDDKEVHYNDDGKEEVVCDGVKTLMILKHLIGDQNEENSEETDDRVDQEKCSDDRSSNDNDGIVY